MQTRNAFLVAATPESLAKAIHTYGLSGVKDITALLDRRGRSEVTGVDTALALARQMPLNTHMNVSAIIARKPNESFAEWEIRVAHHPVISIIRGNFRMWMPVLCA